MKLRGSFITALAAIALVGRPLPTFGDVGAAVEGELLVGLAPEYDTESTPTTFSAVGKALAHENAIHTRRIRLASGVPMTDAINMLRSMPGVLFVEQNHIVHAFGGQSIAPVAPVPNDPLFGDQWAPQRTQADLAWTIWKPQTRVILAIVDTGVDGTHPDLINKMLRNGSSIVGYDAITQTAGNGMDVSGHGTHCAGIAAAEVNNGIGIAGIAGLSDNSVEIMPVCVLDANENGTDADVARGIIWAADNGASVINLSFGGTDNSQTVNSAISYAWGKGCIIVAAAGNNTSSAPYYPAAAQDVISVAATDSNDSMASFSNYGSWITVAAPGVNIASTLPTYATGNGWPTNYGIMSGTSMAAPHVAAEAALLEAQNPDLTNAEVVSIIRQNVDPYVYVAGRSISNGSGRINIYRALQAATALYIAPATPYVPKAAAPLPRITAGPPPPTPPSGLAAVAGDGFVSLNWHTSANAAGYDVLRSSRSNGTYATIASVGAGLQFRDYTAADGVTYYYVVAAHNSLGVTANSGAAAATPQAVLPAPPVNVTAHSESFSVRLSWSFGSQLPPASVRIYRATGRMGKLTLYHTIAPSTSWTDTSTADGIPYSYALTSVSASGRESAMSSVVAAAAY